LAKAEWGNKRTCQGCSARFYDLRREMMVCPKCGQQHTAESFAKTRRVRQAAPVEEKVVAARPAPEELLVVADAEIETDAEEEEDEELIEDASELAEDDTDVADVIGGVDDTEEDVRS
jgi:uncharacterized protein (TIGR02300 family)